MNTITYFHCLSAQCLPISGDERIMMLKPSRASSTGARARHSHCMNNNGILRGSARFVPFCTQQRVTLREHRLRKLGPARNRTRLGSVSPFNSRGMGDQSLTLDQRKEAAEKEYAGYKEHFPEVSDISAAELHDLLEKEPDKVVLIDVRTPEEREVSRIPGKVVLTADEYDKLKEELKERLAVCYCTAGMRSGKHAAKLQKEGVLVKNLKSSIIAWTQEGYPLAKGNDSGEPTKRVHAFGDRWATQMGDGYELQTFNKAKGALEITRSALPKWLGGTG